jgi:hypothetical protein
MPHDVLHEPSALSGPLSWDPFPEFGRAEATRRLLARAAGENPYPHCPRCGRALLALARRRFACPGGHVIIASPARRPVIWQWIRAIFGHNRVGVRA